MDLQGYIEKYGHESIKNKPINEVDLGFFAFASYLEFPLCYSEESKLNIDSSFDDFAKENGKYIKKMANLTISPKEAFNTSKAFFKSKRFKKTKILNYRIEEIPKSYIQYGVFLFKLDEDNYVISYRGTSPVIYGWEEDILMLIGSIESESFAVEDLIKFISIIPEGKKIYVVGHSKGGELASYASTYANKDIQNRISKIISFDGPGRKVPLYQQEGFKNIKSKYLKLIPVDDVIGVMLNDFSDYKVVVADTSNGVSQHSLFTWHCHQNSFIKADSLSKNSIAFSLAFNTWINSVSEEEAKTIIHQIFELLDKSGIKAINDLGNTITEQMRTLANLYKSVPKSNRKAAYKATQTLFKLFLKYRFSSLPNNSKKKKVKNT